MIAKVFPEAPRRRDAWKVFRGKFEPQVRVEQDRKTTEGVIGSVTETLRGGLVRVHADGATLSIMRPREPFNPGDDGGYLYALLPKPRDAFRVLVGAYTPRLVSLLPAQTHQAISATVSFWRSGKPNLALIGAVAVGEFAHRLDEFRRELKELNPEEVPA